MATSEPSQFRYHFGIDAGRVGVHRQTGSNGFGRGCGFCVFSDGEMSNVMNYQIDRGISPTKNRFRLASLGSPWCCVGCLSDACWIALARVGAPLDRLGVAWLQLKFASCSSEADRQTAQPVQTGANGRTRQAYQMLRWCDAWWNRVERAGLGVNRRQRALNRYEQSRIAEQRAAAH